MVFKIDITTLSGKRVSVNRTFKTRSEAKRFKNKILDAKIGAPKLKGKSTLTGLNPRVRKIRRRKK